MAPIDLLTTVGSAFIGGGVGSGLTYLLQLKRDQDKEDNTRQSLRESIWAELRSHGVWDGEYDSPPRVPSFETIVFESNAQHLGLLTKDERLTVIEYYGTLDIYTRFKQPSWESFHVYKRRRDDALSEIHKYLGPEYEKLDSEDETSG